MNTVLCTCDSPYCPDEHALYVPTTITEEAPDDATGPEQEGLGYSEYDAEAYGEMVWQDMAELS